MNKKNDLKFGTMMAARDYGIGTILFRNAMAKKLGLTLTESVCLTMLGVNGALTPTQLAKFTGLTSGSTTAMLDRLEKRGYIVRKANSKDRRGLIVETTDAYNKEAVAMVAGIQKANQDVIDRYSDAELETIRSFLEGFAKNLEEQTKKIETDAE